MLATLAGAKLGATIAGIAVGLGGAATVVYVSANVTHTPDAHASASATHRTDATATSPASSVSTGNAAATGTPTPQGTPVGPDATGAAAHGLCTAWKAVAANAHGKAMDSVAFANLAKAAGGADKVAAWCATVTAPGSSGEHATGKPSSAGRPTTVPGKPTTVPTGRPTTAPTGRPTTVPTGRPTTLPPGQPTTVPTPTTHPAGRG